MTHNEQVLPDALQKTLSKFFCVGNACDSTTCLYCKVNVVHGLLTSAVTDVEACQFPIAYTGHNVETKSVFTPLTSVLRLLRNACASGASIQRKIQEVVPELLQTILDIAHLIAYDGERKSDDPTEELDKQHKDFLTLWDESERVKYTKTVLQTAGNAYVQHDAGQEVLWTQCFPQTFEALLQCVPASCTDLVCMLLYNCVVGSVERLHALTSTPGGWRVCALVLERSSPCDNDYANPTTPVASQHAQHPEWAGYLMVHIVRAEGSEIDTTPFVALYNGLAQLVATPQSYRDDVPDGVSTLNRTEKAANDTDSTQSAGHHRTAAMIPRGDFAKLSLLKWAWGHIREGLDAQEASGNTHVPPVLLPFAGGTTKFLVERFRLLSYLGRDQAWWSETANRGPAGILATVIPLLGDMVLLCGVPMQTALHEHNALDSAVELLAALTHWTPTTATPSTAPSATPTLTDTPPLSMGFGVARDVVRLIGMQVFRHKASQDALHTLEGIPLLLQHFMYDDNNPWCREWATVAVRNACEGNADNQRVLAAVETAPSDVANSAELEQYGMEVTVDRASGKLRTRKKPQQQHV